MDDDLRWNVYDILNNRNEWWVLLPASCLTTMRKHMPAVHIPSSSPTN